LQTFVKQLVGGEDGDSSPIATNLPERHSYKVKRKIIITKREFILDLQVDEYDIKHVMLQLYLGFDVNIS
jgi:hypothetical protein